MKTTFKFLLLFATILLVGCKKSPEEIFAEQKSGVVLICNEYYMTLRLPMAVIYTLRDWMRMVTSMV